MALRDQPYLPLYVQDYLTDEKLNECCASTQGIYIKIMCIMHKSNEYGCILLEQKYKQTDDQIKNFALKLVKHLPFSESEIFNSLTELLNEKVLHLEDDKIYQKRMVKDNLISLKRSEAGQKGGKQTQFAKANNEASNKANSEDENEDGNEIKDKEKKKEYPQELIDLNERCKVYFDEKYVNEKSLECFNVLINKGYAISDIKKAILNGRNDDFWSKQFQSPLKLNKKDKCDVLFIDVFLKLKQTSSVKDKEQVFVPKLKKLI